MHRAHTGLILLASILLMGMEGNDPDLCAPAPLTGCAQSADVEVTFFESTHPYKWLLWSWEDGEDADFGDPTSATDYALCVYDGENTPQTELEAPAPGADSLVVGMDMPAGKPWFGFGHRFIYLSFKAKPDGVYFALSGLGHKGSHVAVLGVAKQDSLAGLNSIDRSQAISQVQTSDGSCFGANVGVRFDNGPQFPAGTDTLDPAAAEPTLDELASLYNSKFGGDPLNMTLWISALASTDIQNQVAQSDPADLDTTALFSALHVAGWYGGMWFARDGFQFPAPPGPDPGQLAAAEFLYAQGRDAALTLDDPGIFDFLTNEVPVPGSFDAGTGLRSLISLYGYNTGYALTVVEDTAGGVIVPPPPSKLACEGSHPPILIPPGEPADSPLLPCTYDPSFLETLDALRPLRDQYVAGFATKAEELRVFQGGEEVRGRQVWTFFLGGIIKAEQAVREALWDVDNAFLEVVHAASLLNMGAQANDDADMGRQAALASSSVLKGWLASYQYGLGAPEPRVLPVFDLGTTPIETR